MTSNKIKNVLVSILKDYGVYRKILKINPIIAGGSVADLLRLSVDSFNEIDLCKAITGDIDIYVPYRDKYFKDPFIYVIDVIKDKTDISYKSYNNFHAKIVKKGLPELNIIRTRDIKGNYVTGRNNMREDLIELISRFDLECVKCGLIINQEKCELYIQPTSPKFIYSKIAKISLNGLELNTLYGILARLYKYKMKGFKLDQDNEYLIKSKAAIENVDLDSICNYKEFGISQGKVDDKIEKYNITSGTLVNFKGVFEGLTYREIIDNLIYG